MIIFVIVLELLYLYLRYKKGVRYEKFREALEKKDKDRTDEEKDVLTYGCINIMQMFITIPYLLYIVFTQPSIPSVLAISMQLAFNMVSDKDVKVVCDVILIICLFWIGFIIYS